MPGAARLLAFGVLLASPPALPAEAVAGSNAALPEASLVGAIDGGLITLDARNVSLARALQAIAALASLELRLPPGLDDANGSWSLHRQPLVATLRQILGCHGWVMAGADTAADVRGYLEVLPCPADPPAQCSECPAPPTAVEALPEAAAPSARDLGEALREDGPRAARGHVAAIAAFDPAVAVPALERGLDIADPTIRLELVRALAAIDDAGALRALGQVALGDRDPVVRAAATQSLRASSHPLAPALLQAALKSAESGQPAATPPAAAARKPGS